MNRLQSSKASAFDLSSSPQSSSSHGLSALAFPGVASRRRERTAPPCYSLFAPLHYERRYAYPLLVWLHDDGGNERELRLLMPHVSVRNYVAAAARGTIKAEESGRAFAWQQSPSAIGESAERVRQCIDVAQQ